jgi:hypothetical protein
MRITADRLMDHTIEVQTTTGLVAATDFSVSTFGGYKVGGMTTVNVVLTYTGASAITANAAGNITDKQCCTLPSGWRPLFTISTSYDRSGVADGALTIASDGACTLKTLSPTATINSGNLITFMATWVSGNA